jgi:hypothetical protein
MAFTQTYVDPAIAGNSGTGTIGDPYGDIQYAFDTMTRDATNGDQINIKAGTDEVLAAVLTLATYGTPSTTAQLILRGYTSAANDGGIGGIDCNAAASLQSAAWSNVSFIDLHIHNTNSSTTHAVYLFENGSVINCEINNSAGDGLRIDRYASVENCYIHDCARYGIYSASSGGVYIAHNYLANGTKDFTRAFYLVARGVIAEHNIISVDGTTDAVYLGFANNIIRNNSIWCNGGSGYGIRDLSPHGFHNIYNNIIEGFTSGTGLYLVSHPFMAGYNAFYNNGTDKNITGTLAYDLGNDFTLTGTPFAGAGSGDFTLTDEALKGTGWPGTIYGSSTPQYMDVGAMQTSPVAGVATFNAKQYKMRTKEIA